MGVRCAEYLKRCRASRSLAKTGFFLRLQIGIFSIFFASFSRPRFLSFFNRFWRGLGRVLEAKMEPTSMQNRIKIEVAKSIYFFIVFFDGERFES